MEFFIVHRKTTGQQGLEFFLLFVALKIIGVIPVFPIFWRKKREVLLGEHIE
jgi:hypothetical protein